jgi:integrase/recombinase XerD
MSNPRAVRISGPLTTFVDGFCAELAGQGYTRDSASLQLQLMAHVSRWLDAEGLVVEDLITARVEDFLRARRAAGYRDLLSDRALVPLMGYLTRLGVVSPSVSVPAPTDLVVDAYRRHLVIDRGLAATTVDYYTKVAREVVVRWDRKGCTLAGVSAIDVSALVVGECRQRNVPSAKALVTALRSWLRFLHAEGVTVHDLAGAVPAVAGWRGGSIPRGLGEAEVAAVLDSVDPMTKVGLRDRAVLVLLARLALRAGEVAGLVLDDVDWRHGEIVVRGKGGRRDRLPLPVDVGEALVAYLRGGRPHVACRALFVRTHAPVVGLSPDGVGAIVVCAGARCGVPATAHRLRHSAATAMLRAGASLSEVGQVLRHADVATTAIYAKVDHGALRAVAQRWPGRAA